MRQETTAAKPSSLAMANGIWERKALADASHIMITDIQAGGDQ